ncbi:MAG: DUF421 domain-containing protein [Chitinophagaceae bacterium]
MDKLFFDTWESLLRTGLITFFSYTLLIIFLRFSGKRTLSKMNAFDMIVTIALGSTLASVMLNKDVALADGALAFLLLILLQLLISKFSMRSAYFNKLVKGTPTLLVYKGEILPEMIRKERINEDELYAVAREKGLSSLAGVHAIILESDGSLSVIEELSSRGRDALEGVQQ